jgi:hypothetical protein
MFVRKVVMLLPLVCGAALAQPKPSPTISAAPAGLSPEEMSHAIKSDDVTIPTPGELFAALSEPAKPDWPSYYRPPIPINYKSRAQIALNLGGLIADGFIAVQAQDTQQVKNIGADIVKMAKGLGVSESILARGNSINQFAENDEWATLQEELEATQNEVKSSMQTHRDEDLVVLVSLGGWIRATQVVSAFVEKNYNQRLGQILRQPELLRFIRSKIGQISPEMQNDPLVKSVNAQLGDVEEIVATPFGRDLSLDEVKKLNARVNGLLQEIQKKEK